jgi:hypothetical protein
MENILQNHKRIRNIILLKKIYISYSFYQKKHYFCKSISGLKMKCKLILGLSINYVNFF